VNKTDLVAKLAERLDGDRATAVTAVNGVLEEIERSVARGERVSLSGFGTFDRRERAARTGRNPRTGESIEVGASVVPVFRAGTAFKAVVTDADGGSRTQQVTAVDGVQRGAKATGREAESAAARPGSVVSAAGGEKAEKKDKKTKGKDTKEKGKKTEKGSGKRADGKKAGKGRG
jgi:DNA-binding protein HU-beta